MTNREESLKINRQTEHWYGIDSIKGLLIIIVFLGHVIPGVLRETYPRYIIYSFHMPLFIGISGFLIDIEKLVDMKIVLVVKKYLKRLGLPWIIAVAVFTVVQYNFNLSTITFEIIVKAYLKPYYHLWYILGFFSYILISYIFFLFFKNNRYRWVLFMLMTSIISFISKWEVLSGTITNPYGKLIYEVVHYDFRLYNLLFLGVGLMFRNRYERKKYITTDTIIEIIRVSSIVAFGIVSILFFFSYDHIEKFLYYILNICLLIPIFFDCTKKQLPRCKTLEFIGKYSLPIYLYHVLCLNATDFFFARGTAENYIICYIVFILGCALICPFRNIKFINEVIFGNG